jgi:hypothetical protein
MIIGDQLIADADLHSSARMINFIKGEKFLPDIQI